MLALLAAVGGLVAIGLAAGPPDDDSEERSVGPSTSGPETISENTTHPPQDDLHGDTECSLNDLGWVRASGTLTNRSSETSRYMIQVSFNDEAGVRFAEAPAFHNDVRAGESVRWEAVAPTGPARTTWTCEVVSIERFASQ